MREARSSAAGTAGGRCADHRVTDGHLIVPPADLNVTWWIEAGVRGLAAVEVRDFAGDLGIHSDYSAGVLDGQ